MATINYRGAKNIPVTVVGTVTSGKHKGMVKVKIQRQVGSRPKGTVDYRKPENVHRGKT